MRQLLLLLSIVLPRSPHFQGCIFVSKRRPWRDSCYLEVLLRLSCPNCPLELSPQVKSLFVWLDECKFSKHICVTYLSIICNEHRMSESTRYNHQILFLQSCDQLRMKLEIDQNNEVGDKQGVNTTLSCISRPKPSCPSRLSPHACAFPITDRATVWLSLSSTCKDTYLYSMKYYYTLQRLMIFWLRDPETAL